MKDLRDLRQEDVVALLYEVNNEVGLDDKAREALALHDNMLILGMMNDFVRIMDLVDLNEVRTREAKNLHLSRDGKKQQEGADRFKENVKRILDKNIDECISTIYRLRGGK